MTPALVALSTLRSREAASSVLFVVKGVLRTVMVPERPAGPKAGAEEEAGAGREAAGRDKAVKSSRSAVQGRRIGDEFSVLLDPASCSASQQNVKTLLQVNGVSA